MLVRDNEVDEPVDIPQPEELEQRNTRFVESAGYLHLFINDYHDSQICAECIKPGSMPAPPPTPPKSAEVEELNRLVLELVDAVWCSRGDGSMQENTAASLRSVKAQHDIKALFAARQQDVQPQGAVGEIDKQLLVDILDLVGDEFAPKQDGGSPERKRLLSLIGPLNTLLAARQTSKETAKAFGGCTNCYGKGYASVNDRWAGRDTDTDIGSTGGYVSGGNANAMKFCKCERGKELERRFKKVAAEAEARARVEGQVKITPLDSPKMIGCANPTHLRPRHFPASYRVRTWDNGEWTVCTAHLDWGKEQALAALTPKPEEKL